MTTPTTAQKEARAENNVIRAFANLYAALRRSGMDHNAQGYQALGQAEGWFKADISNRREFRKQKREGKI